MWDGDRLAFDSQGNLIGTATTLPFSLSAVDVNQVRLTGSTLEIEGRREALTYERSITAVSYKSAKDVHITIALDWQHPDAVNDAVARIFSIGVDEELAAHAPEYWQYWLRANLRFEEARTGSSGPSGKTAPYPRPFDDYRDAIAEFGSLYHPGGGITNPRLISAPDPQYNEAARDAHLQGVVVIGLVVDSSGRPQRVRIVSPIGFGLDENAVETVRQYHFAPSIYRDKPVAVAINIEVNYRIYDPPQTPDR